jgi:adenylate cyclase
MQSISPIAPSSAKRNEVARIASMCRSADRDVLLSANFAAAVVTGGTGSPVSVGRYALRGVVRPQELFTLDRQLGS